MPRLSRAPLRRHAAPSVARRRMLGAIVLGVALLVVVLGVAKPNPFARHLTVRALFDDAAAIGVVGADVRVAGAPIGRITDVRRIGDRALVTMHVDRDVGSLGADATAELRPRTAFEGTAFVALDPGSASGPRLGDRSIPPSRTRNFVPLDEALRFAQPDVRAALRADVRDLRGVLQGAGGAGLQATLRGTPALTRDLGPAARAAQGSHGAELHRAVNGFAATTRALARRRADLGPLVRSAPPTFAALNTDAGAPLGRTLAELSARLAQLDAGGRALRSLVDRLDVVGSELRPALRALEPTLARTRPLLRAARPVLADAAPLVVDLRAALPAGARASRPARSLLQTLDPSLALLQDSLLPALAAKTKFGMPAYLQFLALFQGGGGASRPFHDAAQSQRGTGHFMRFGARFFTGIGYPLPPCDALARVNADLARQLGAQGVCTP